MLKLKNIFTKIKSDKKKLALLISVLIITFGVIPLTFLTLIPDLQNPYKIESISLTSEDGTKLHALKYTPNGVKSHGGIVVGHGYCGNAQHMQPLSIELAKRGFTVINVDFRGHGASEGYLLRTELINDVKAAVDYLDNLSYITEIGLVGHSMGSGAVTSFARTYPARIKATVAIGNIPSNFTNISNLLMAIGLFEQGITKDDLLEVLISYTGLPTVEIDVLYGDFNIGTASKGFIGSFSEHLFEVKDPSIIYETVQWFEQAFNGARANNIKLTATSLQIFSYISLFGVVAFNFVIAIYFGNYIFKRRTVYPEKQILKDVKTISIYKLVIYYTIPAVLIEFIFFIFLSDVFSGIIPLSSSEQWMTSLIGAAVGAVIVYYALIMRKAQNLSFKTFPSKIKLMTSPNTLKSIIFGILMALLMIFSIAAVWHWSVHYTLPSVMEFGTMMGLTLILFPFLLIKEFYFRNVQGQFKTANRYKEYFSMVGIGFFMDNLLIILVMLIAWLHIYSGLISALFLSVWVLFSLIQEFATTWIYMNSGRNILGSTIFRCIFFAWIAVSFFPYGFL